MQSKISRKKFAFGNKPLNLTKTYPYRGSPGSMIVPGGGKPSESNLSIALGSLGSHPAKYEWNYSYQNHKELI